MLRMEDRSMETLAPTSTWRHRRIRITSRCPTEFIDITDQLEALVAEAGIDAGFVNVQTLHTTTAIVVNEHEPLLLGDFRALLEQIAPLGRPYQHDVGIRAVDPVPDERRNGHSHCRALLLAASICLNVGDGRLQLGRWQRVFLAELDGPQLREVSIVVVGGGGR
jgi:secondary thiamine-phosphate synthase enzyme